MCLSKEKSKTKVIILLVGKTFEDSCMVGSFFHKYSFLFILKSEVRKEGKEWRRRRIFENWKNRM